MTLRAGLRALLETVVHGSASCVALVCVALAHPSPPPLNLVGLATSKAVERLGLRLRLRLGLGLANGWGWSWGVEAGVGLGACLGLGLRLRLELELGLGLSRSLRLSLVLGLGVRLGFEAGMIPRNLQIWKGV